MYLEDEKRILSIVVSDGIKDNLFKNVINILKQTSFKKGIMDVAVFFQDVSEKEQLVFINKYFSEERINFFPLSNIIVVLKNQLEKRNYEFINIIFERISLRPDALELLSSYLANNSSIDGAYSDFLLCTEKDLEFEIAESYFASNFPAELAMIPKTTKLFPTIFLISKEKFVDIFKNFTLPSSFNLLNFYNSLWEDKLKFEKLEAVLGAKCIKIDDNNEHIINNQIKEKWILEKLNQIYGSAIIRTFSFNEYLGLPYHFSNPFNDLVSIVILKKSDEAEKYSKQTIDSLNLQTHRNIEVLECVCEREFDVSTRNFFSLISSGKYLLFIRSGDEIFPNSLAKLIDLAKHNNSNKYIYFDYVQQSEQRIVRQLDFNFDKLKRFNYISEYIFFNREVFLKGNLLDEELPYGYSLWEFLIRIGKQGTIGLRCPEPLVKVESTQALIDIDNKQEDVFYKAKIVSKHKDIFTDMQVEWANSVLLGNNLFDNSKIPAGIIPNNILLTKIITNKLEVGSMDRKRKILFVMYGWKETGGGTTFPRSVAKELSRRGWDVSVFYASLKFDPTMPLYSLEFTKEDGVNLYGLYNRPAAFNDPENPERETSDPKVEKAFLEVAGKVAPDLIHIHNLHGLCLSLPKIAKEKLGVPILFTPHNYFLIDPLLYMINSDLEVWKDTDFFKNSELVKKYPDKLQHYQKRQEFSKQIITEYLDLILAVSRRQKEILSQFAENSRNIIVVHQTNEVVDSLWSSEKLKVEANRPVPKKLRYGYIGGIFPTKGVHNIVIAAQNFLPNDVEFHIYGFVTPRYSEQLRELDKRRIINYHGEYSVDDLERIASEIDVGIVPSIYEDPAPLVLLELNGMRLPILGSKIGGIPDFVVDGVNGFLFDYNDVDSLISAIRYCSLNPEVVERMRKVLKPIHTFKEYIEHLEKIYNAFFDKKFRNPRDYELIVTSRLYSLNKVDNVRFVKIDTLPSEIERSFASLGYELTNLNVISENDNYIVYNAEFKVPKEVTLDEFLEAKEQSKVEEEEESPVEMPANEVAEEKVFELDDLEQLVAPGAGERRQKIEEQQVLFESGPSTITEKTMTEKNQPELNVVWEGSQFVYHSLALINREHCSNLIDTELVEVTIVPYETEQFQPVGNPKYEKLARKDIRVKETPPDWVRKLPYIWIRHQWPPKAEPPKGAKWVIMQPWEFTTLPKKFVEIFLQADELWVPSNYTRQAFFNSGIPFNKVQIVPNGIDPDLFKPKGNRYHLPTDKKLKFLFVGGTTYRKGFDILLQSYVTAFTSKDDVCLVVKDMGTESFYRGQTAEELIEKVRNTPNSPEIIYIKEYLSEEEMASLYRACDVFVSPYRGEGFSLPTLEAMACGLPVIVTDGGSTEDFVLDTFAWKIPSYKVSIGSMIDGEPLVGEAFLLEPDGDYLTGLMKAIYQNPGDILVRGILASSYARMYWTWKRSTLKLLSRIDALYGKELSKKAKDILVDKIDAQILLGLAEESSSNGELAEAYKIFREVESRFNEIDERYRVFCLLRIAIIHILNNDFENANAYIKKVESLSRENIDALYLNSKILYLQNKLVEALEHYTVLVSRWNKERFSSMIGNSLEQILVEMADIMFDMNDIDSALQLYTNAIKINENKVEGYIGSAKCFLKIGDNEEAKRMIEWAEKIDPENEQVKELIEQLFVQN
jgi:glycosyltransferase involved in cell wall biosynthesis